jgi:hypothetical protein
MSYARPRTNLDVVTAGAVVSKDAMTRQLARADSDRAAPQLLDPLRIEVPKAGIHYAFEKLYANQADQDAWIALPYASTGGALLGRLLAVVGTLAFWLGLATYGRLDPRLPWLSPRASAVIAGAGVLVLISVGRYGVGLVPALLLSLALLGAAAMLRFRGRLAVAPQ